MPRQISRLRGLESICGREYELNRHFSSASRESKPRNRAGMPRPPVSL